MDFRSNPSLISLDLVPMEMSEASEWGSHETGKSRVSFVGLRHQINYLLLNLQRFDFPFLMLYNVIKINFYDVVIIISNVLICEHYVIALPSLFDLEKM